MVIHKGRIEEGTKEIKGKDRSRSKKGRKNELME